MGRSTPGRFLPSPDMGPVPFCPQQGGHADRAARASPDQKLCCPVQVHLRERQAAWGARRKPLDIPTACPGRWQVPVIPSALVRQSGRLGRAAVPASVCRPAKHAEAPHIYQTAEHSNSNATRTSVR